MSNGTLMGAAQDVLRQIREGATGEGETTLLLAMILVKLCTTVTVIPVEECDCEECREEKTPGIN